MSGPARGDYRELLRLRGAIGDTEDDAVERLAAMSSGAERVSCHLVNSGYSREAADNAGSADKPATPVKEHTCAVAQQHPS